jgi:hypothetical protein
MNQVNRFAETIAAYSKHDWQLRRVLVCEASRDLVAKSIDDVFGGIEPVVSSVDALWFARPSHGGREAWELRLVGESPYALFESFEADAEADLVEKTLNEMETRLIEYAARA